MKPVATDTSFEEVLSFWFDGADAADASPGALARAVQRWFQSDPAFDAAIAQRFGPVVEAALAGAFDEWCEQPASWLALLIVLDQFPRNIRRGSADAFAGDARAQRIALSGLDTGFDRALAPLQRVFAYLPLEHAEDATLQARSVALFDALRGEVDAALRPTFDVFHDYAVRHREVIDRFGRFPHRNVALGRASTPDERAYLATPGAGF
jgi:uncharacterized protein (DUF924 family)